MKDVQTAKQKLLHTTETLWGNVLSRTNFAKKDKKKDGDKGIKEKDLQQAYWKNYVLYMFSKIVEKNFQHQEMLKRTMKESKKLVDTLNRTGVISEKLPTTSPEEITKRAKVIENLLVETMARIFVRNVLNDGKRKILLQDHLKYKEHELLMAYGSDEYRNQYYLRKQQEKLEKEKKEKELARRKFITTLFAPFLTEEIINQGEKNAFQKLYDPFHSISLDPATFLPRDLLSKVESKFNKYWKTILRTTFHLLSLQYLAKRVTLKRKRRVIRNIFNFIKTFRSRTLLLNREARRIQTFARAFIYRCRFSNHIRFEKDLLARGQAFYDQKILFDRKRKAYFMFWRKQFSLMNRYQKTVYALKERRFLICFYTWKDKFIKLKYSKMKLSKLQLRSCIIIQCFIRVFLSRIRVRKLRAVRKIKSMIKIRRARLYRLQLQDYRRKIEGDYCSRAKFNSLFSLLKETFSLWKRSYSILTGLEKVSKAREHYNMRVRLGKWKEFSRLKTIYLSKYATKIQAVARRYIVWKWYWHFRRWRKSFIKLQSLVRKCQAIAYFQYHIYYYRKARIIQTRYRGYRVRKNLYKARINDINYAASHNKYERLKYYCEKFPDLIYLKDDEGNSPLHSAAKNAAKRTLKLLVRQMKLNPNESNYAGFTPLHLLIMSTAVHRDEVFSYCLEHGFDDDNLTSTGKSCVLLAAEYNRMIILKRLLDDGHDANLADVNGLTPLQCACRQGNLSMVHLLIENEANVHQAGMNGTFPIHDCITGQNIEVLYTLLHQKVDVNVTDSFYLQTPLMWACQAGLPEFIRTLVVHHADIHLRDYQGQTCAHYAALTNVSDVYHALREADVEFDVTDNEGNSPLHLSAYYGTTEMTKNILHGGAYPSYQNDKDGEQPSHIAAKYNQIEILKLLCEYDEYIGRPNYNHKTPLGLAKLYRCQECIAFLEQHYRMVEIIDGRNNVGEVWWDKTIDEQILVHWDVEVDSNGNRTYINKQSGQRTTKPPSIESADVIKKLATQKNKLPLKRVIELVKEEDQPADGGGEEEGDEGKAKKLTKHEYYLNYRKTKQDIKEMNRIYRAATIITKYVRRKLAYKEAKRLREVKASLKKIRRFYRLFIKPFMFKCRQSHARKVTKFQAVLRSYQLRKKFFGPDGLYFEYRIRWAKRTLRYKLWDMYCFYRFLKEFKLKVQIKHHFNYTLQDWQIILDRIHHIPLRTINIFEEYKFPGTMNLKFYRNTLTGNCFFNKPKEIILFDEQEIRDGVEKRANGGLTRRQFILVVKLQALMRGYLIRNSYKYLEKAMTICQYAKQNYLNAPEKDSNLYNYALSTFVIDQDLDRARPIFLECLRRMQWRGPDIAFVLYSYAIFAMKSHDEDIADILALVERANRAERLRHERFVEQLERKFQLTVAGTQASAAAASLSGGDSLTSPRGGLLSPRDDGSLMTVSTLQSRMQPLQYGRCYDLAKFGFFLYAAKTFENSYGWECYALCQFLVYKDFFKSFDAFMNAFKTDPENMKLRQTFDQMMTFFHGKDKEYKDAIVKERMRYLAAMDNQVEENRRRARERQLKRELSAKKIQVRIP